MGLLKKLEISLKNGFYIDYFFKNLYFISLNNILTKNLFYFLDKYLAEKLFYKIKYFFNTIYGLTNLFKNLQFYQLLKITILIGVQLILIFFL